LAGLGTKKTLQVHVSQHSNQGAVMASDSQTPWRRQPKLVTPLQALQWLTQG